MVQLCEPPNRGLRAQRARRHQPARVLAVRGEPGRLSNTSLALIGLVMALGCFEGIAQTNPVQLELVITPARLRVIGDAIPLAWRFRNVSTQSLAFMWEGCCRLNGRLEVMRDGSTIDAIPPGQAIAHRFAKAERLDPNQARDFETLLTDWVQLDRTGNYTVRGRYTGVLPDQRPQVQRGIVLWREAAESRPLRLEILAVADYLERRPLLSQARGLTVSLSAPGRFEHLEPTILKVSVTNTGSSQASIAWPDDVDLWITRVGGRRISGSLGGFETARETLTIPPRQSVERTVPIDSRRLEGEPFGDLQAFVEFREQTDHDRVPSNPVLLRWGLDETGVAQLLERAAAGPASGLRNNALKRLRVYLQDVQPALAHLGAGPLEPATRRLCDQLLVAGKLKPLSPLPGEVDIVLKPGTGGAGWRVATVASNVCAQLAPLDGIAAVRRVCEVRRHLGWEPRLRLDPNGETPILALFDLLRDVGPLRSDLADEPMILVSDATGPLPGGVVTRTETPSAGMLARLKRDGQNDRVRVLVRATAGPPTRDSAQTQGETNRLGWVPLADGDSGSQWASRVAAQGVSPILVVDRDMPWRIVEEFCLPFSKRGLPVSLALPPVDEPPR